MTKAETIASLNDALRATLTGGRVNMSAAVAAMSPADIDDVLDTLRTFNDFNADNDPHGERDCAIFEAAGHRCMFKIDYYAKGDDMHGSETPEDAAATDRVMVVMLASDY